MILVKDIIQYKELGEGFVVFETKEGFFLGAMNCDCKIEYTQKIDRDAFLRIKK